jgi:hypothetical protein
MSFLEKCLALIDRMSDPHTTIFVSIGSAAHTKKYDVSKGEWTIPENTNQEYPVFLKNLQKKYPYVPIHIFLIDPELESIPFIVANHKNKSNKWADTQINSEWTADSMIDDVFHNVTKNMHVYCFRNYVSYFGDDNLCTGCSSVNIESFIDNLVSQSVKKHWLTIFHDFSGKSCQNLASLYDARLGEHIDHIIFGLAARDDGGCYIDLEHPSCNFYYSIDLYGKLIVFNPYLYNDNLYGLIKYVDALEKHGSLDDARCAIEQTKIYIKTKKEMLWTCVGILRRIKIMQTNTHILLSAHELTYISKKYGVLFDDMIMKKEYDQLFDIILDVVHKESIILFSIFSHDEKFDVMSTTIQIIDNIMAERDPYKWLRIVLLQLEYCIERYQSKYLFD